MCQYYLTRGKFKVIETFKSYRTRDRVVVHYLEKYCCCYCETVIPYQISLIIPEHFHHNGEKHESYRSINQTRDLSPSNH